MAATQKKIAGISNGKKNPKKETWNEVDRRDEQQWQSDEKKVISESTHKALTEEH